MRVWNSTGYVDPTQALALARASESAGFAGICLPDHAAYPRYLTDPYPYTADGSLPFPPETPWPDAFCMISAMAAVTERIHFTTGVYIAPARPLHVVAHQVATASVLSAGRVSIGVGAGWMAEDFAAFGQDFGNRGRRLDEMIPALRALWQPGWVSWSGEYYQVPEIRLTPTPSDPVKIHVGGDSDAARERVARLGDGWILAGPMPVEAVVERLDDMDRRLERAGRDRSSLWVLAMATDAWNRAELERLAATGIDDVVCVPWTDPGSPLDEKLAAVERFADEVIAHLA
jgi:probable F420-dependent oxidoreductase